MSTLHNATSILQINMTKLQSQTFFYSEKYCTALMWIEIAINERLQFLFVESATARRLSNVESISQSNLRRYLNI